MLLRSMIDQHLENYLGYLGSSETESFCKFEEYNFVRYLRLHLNHDDNLDELLGKIGHDHDHGHDLEIHPDHENLNYKMNYFFRHKTFLTTRAGWTHRT